MLVITKKTKVIEGYHANNLPVDVLTGNEPVILKGLIKDWPLVQAGLQSDEAAVDYLKSHYNGKEAGVYFGEPDIKGRYFYNEDTTKLNFAIKGTPLNEMLDKILQHKPDKMPPSFYIASNNIYNHFPSLLEDNDVSFHPDIFSPLEEKDVTLLKSIWIGNESLVSCHYDSPLNLACCVAGKRRFTLFPPDQIHNLYPGPLEPTPGGQTISLVDFRNPDFNKFPNFSKAMAAGQVAEMEPGDALFFPSMWWHQVEGLSKFNILVNYWWDAVPKFMGQGVNVLTHALLSLKDRSFDEKMAWKHIFDYYIFNQSTDFIDHIPEGARGALSPLDELQSRKLRTQLLNKLNR